MLRRMTTAAAILLLVMTLGVVGGCSSVGSSLDGTRWRLSGWTLSSLNPASFTITAQFANGEISGNSGVNAYSGPVKLGPGAAFSAGPLAGTLMAGTEPAMRAESAYLTLLGQAKSYKVTADKLTLYDGNGNESLVFDAVRDHTKPGRQPGSQSSSGATSSLSASETIAVYELVVRRLIGPDDTAGGSVPKPVVYLVRAPLLTEPELRADSSTPATIPLDVQLAITKRIATPKSRVVWVDRFESVPLDERTGAVSGGGVIVTIGDIRWLGKERAHVAGSTYFANLGAGGRTYVLDLANGEWKITGTTGAEWIS